MKLINSKAAAVAAIFPLLTALPTHAAFQTMDDINWGVNSMVRDTETNLDWLKPIETTNLSYPTISSQLGIGSYTGFRYASLSEVKTLFTNAGMPLVCCYDGFNPAAHFGNIVSFVNLFGATYVAGTGKLNDVAYGVSGLLEPTQGEIDPQYANALYSIIVNAFPGYTNGTQFGSIDENYQHPNTGSWLIRREVINPDPVSSIPEPGTYTMLILGLGILGAVARRKAG